MTWRDENFKPIVDSGKDAPYEHQIDWSKHWNPKYDFTNDVEITYINRYSTQVYDERIGTETHTRVMSRIRVKGMFFERFELGGFPFDMQSLRVGLRARKNIGRMYFAPPRFTKHRSVFTGSRFKLPEWTFVTIKGPEGTPFTKFIPDPSEVQPGEFNTVDIDNPIANRKSKSLFIFNMPVARREGFYILNVIPLNCVIVFLGWTGFSIPIDEVADRLSVVITLLLTSTAFKYVITEKLPRIDYPTKLDWYMLTGMFLLLLQGLFHVIAVLLDSSSLVDTKTLRALEWGALALLVVIFCHSNYKFFKYRRAHWRVQRLPPDELRRTLKTMEDTRGTAENILSSDMVTDARGVDSDGESTDAESDDENQENDQDAELDALQRRRW